MPRQLDRTYASGVDEKIAVTGRLRSVLSRWTTSQATVDAVQDEARSHEAGGSRCGELSGRKRVVLAGALRSVTLRPRAGVPALEAEMSDGTGTVSVIWLGRREIVGVEVGRWVRVEGLVACRDGRKVMYNPRYELLPGRAT